MEIKKLGYSAKPWRLLTSDGYEVRTPIDFDHPDIGMTRLMESVAGDTRKECESNALALLERMLFAPSAIDLNAARNNQRSQHEHS